MQIDAFIQRLRDLLEICICQKLFARRVEGFQEELPLYPGNLNTIRHNDKFLRWFYIRHILLYKGVKAPDITRGMMEIQRIFDKELDKLYEHSDLILDVQNPEWHDVVMEFHAVVKHLEIMVQDILFNAFESISNIEQGIFYFLIL